MAERPVFIPQKSGELLVKTEYIKFEWYSGLAISQKQKSINSLHQSAIRQEICEFPLEISSKSEVKIGNDLSAFNLTSQTKNSKNFTVETLFQSSKVFEKGGPYRDLLTLKSKEAKKDLRLKNSGRLVKFDLFGEEWPLEPLTAFYDWVYINTLLKNKHLAEQALNYDAFTDIEFNPKKSINCQAYALALFCSLTSRGILDRITGNRVAYFNILENRTISNAAENNFNQLKLI